MIKQVPTEPTNLASGTECNHQAILFPELISGKTVTVDFEGEHISSDGGSVLLGRLDRSYGYLKRFERCFTDHRNEALIQHPVLDMVRQRVYGLALGYEDLNDHDHLRSDPLLASACGKEDPLGLEEFWLRRSLDKRLGADAELTLFGRAAQALGYPNTPSSFHNARECVG